MRHADQAFELWKKAKYEDLTRFDERYARHTLGDHGVVYADNSVLVLPASHDDHILVLGSVGEYRAIGGRGVVKEYAPRVIGR